VELEGLAEVIQVEEGCTEGLADVVWVEGEGILRILGALSYMRRRD
jgi:hypothetical protein